MTETPLTVREYVVLPLSIHAPPSMRNKDPIVHYLYIRPHAPKLPDADTPRSLFVANSPIDAALLHFRFLFSDQLDAGRVERVDFEPRPSLANERLSPRQSDVTATPGLLRGKKRKIGATNPDTNVASLPDTWDRRLHKSGSAATVVFVDRTSMERAFKCVKKASRASKPLLWNDNPVSENLPPLGSGRYRMHHKLQYPQRAQLQSAVDNFMTDLSAREVAAAAERARLRLEPDADGFITVTRGGRVGAGRSDDAQEKLEKLKEREEKKRKEMEASGFYRFQTREAKKKEAQDLIQRFENDKRRMQEMTKRRKRQKPD